MQLYKDRQLQADANLFRSVFPEQTKTLPRIIVWSIIFLLNLMLCVFGAARLGLLDTRCGQLLTFAAIFGGFWLLGRIW